MIGKFRLNSILNYEIKKKINNKSTYLNFKKRIDILKYQTLKWLDSEKKMVKKLLDMVQVQKEMFYYNITVLIQIYSLHSREEY